MLEKKEKLLTDRAVLSSCAPFRMKKEENSDRTAEQPLYHYEAKSIERRSCLRKVPSGNSTGLSDSKVSQMPNSPYFSPVSDGAFSNSMQLSGMNEKLLQAEDMLKKAAALPLWFASYISNMQ